MSTYSTDKSPKTITRTFHLISALLGAAYGAYGSYVFIYLDSLKTTTPGFDPLNSLLLVLACTMFFEFIAEPATGNFADTNGRRPSVVIAFTLVGVSFLLYAAIAFTNRTPQVIYGMAIGAEFLLAIGLAFHSGSFEAWFVDALNSISAPTEADLERYFARNSQFFTLGLTLGGCLALFMSSTLIGATNYAEQHPATLSFPWIFSSVMAFIAMFFAGVNMQEPPRPPLAANAPIQKSNILNRFAIVLKEVALRRAIMISASGYVLGIVFMYFAPLLVLQSASEHNASRIEKWFFTLPFLLAIPRIAGASLAIGLQKVISDVRRRMLMLGLIASLLIAVLGLLPALLDSTWEPFVILGVAVTFWLFWHASRPVQNAYLNSTVADSGSRAFAISVATGLGSGIIALFSLVLIALHGFGPSIPINGLTPVFVVIGSIAALLTILGTKAPQNNGSNGTELS